MGIAGLLFVPSARVWGKRHLYLLGTIVLIFSSAWGGASGKNYTSLLWARIFQGVGLAPFEALVNASVGDLYFVHQRGKRMALTNLSLFGGAFFTPVIVGKMTHSMGWPWTFNFVAIFAGVMLPLVIFFVPETAYRRDPRLNTDTSMIVEDHPEASKEAPAMDVEATPRYPAAPNDDGIGKAAGDTEARRLHDGEQVVPPKVSFTRSLMPFNGRKTDEGYFHLLLRPFPLFAHPGILWVCFHFPPSYLQTTIPN